MIRGKCCEVYKLFEIQSSDRSGSNFFDSGRVSHLRFEFGFGKFPLKMSNVSIFFHSGKKNLFWTGSKNTWVIGGSASYLLLVNC